jgi:hypothetical protein
VGGGASQDVQVACIQEGAQMTNLTLSQLSGLIFRACDNLIAAQLENPDKHTFYVPCVLE